MSITSPRPTGLPVAGGEPLGVLVARVAKAADRAFDEELDGVGGSLSAWRVVEALKLHRPRTQRELAGLLGIEGPTLTHHLTGLESRGLVTRSREPDNRRVVRVELTPDGETAYERMRIAASGFDARLCAGLDDGESELLRAALARLERNARGRLPTA